MCDRRRDLKKLLKAARIWARSLSGSRGKDTRAADLRAFKAPPDQLRKLEQRQIRQREPFGVLPCNWQVVTLFMQLQTQWRRAGANGVMVGLDYTAVHAAVQLMGITPEKDLLQKLQAMEFEIMRELAKK